MLDAMQRVWKVQQSFYKMLPKLHAEMSVHYRSEVACGRLETGSGQGRAGHEYE